MPEMVTPEAAAGDEAAVGDEAAAAPGARHGRRHRGRRRKAAVALVVLVVLAAAGAATAAMLGLGGGDQANDQAASELPPGTAKVTRETLRDTQSADGDLGYGPTTTATSRLAGTLTYLPEGDSRISRGQALYKVDDEPVTLMYGSMPAYRALTVGVEGTDVEQLEQNLSALGYTGFTVDEEYTSGTAEAVRRWQEDQGRDKTGTVELGRVVFAPEAVRVDNLQAGEGDPVGPGQKVLTYTGTAKAVTAELDAADRRLAEKGATVRVTLPDDTTIEGRVDEVSTVIEPGNGQGDEPTTKVEVVVGLPDQQAADAYALASVDVTFTADERKDVLSVPVAALLALREGGFGVEVVDGSTTRYVPVRTGLFADGKVEISAAGITAGTTVGMPK
jgi:peptidoglycan hydrolase-like protein with peptidoglycan-binding domain